MSVVTPLFVVGKFLYGLLPAMCGAAISLYFDKKKVTKTNMFVSYLLSVMLAYYIGRGISQWIGTDEVIGTAIVVTTGMFGLSIASNLYIAIPVIIKSQLKRFGVIKGD